MSFTRYGAYRESGVDWLGPVPSHWVVTSLKRGYSVTLGKMLQPDAASPDDALLPYLRAANIQWSGVDCADIKTMWFSKRDREQLQLKAGDLLVSEGGDVGRSALWRGEIDECYFQNSVNRVRPRKGNLTPFLSYWMSTMKDKGFIDVLCNKSTIAHFTAEKVGAVPVPLPPPHEQQEIASFLDDETAKIDALVEEQRRLTELLKEKRHAVISLAVTKGLNPNVPMKDSGVEWLGKVPAHWKVLRVKDVARLESGHTPSKSVPEYWENCTIPWVSLNDSKQLAVSDYITETAFQINELGLANSSARMLPAGTVVFTRDATIGLAAITTKPMAVSQHLIAWCPSDDIDALYLLRVFNVMKRFLDSATFGATIKTIGMADVKKLVTPVPPRSEQLEITAAVARNIDRIDTLVREVGLSIDLLRERRTALISAAVTGKINVLGLASRTDTVAA